MRKIADLADDESPRGQLRRFIYIVSALVHHEKHGGLTTAQIKRAVEVARGILQINGVKPGSSRLSFLHGELHLVLSQIYRHEGQHWQAVWEQQMAIYDAKQNLPGGARFQALSLAHRSLRLGHARLALLYYEQANASEKLKDSAKESAHLGMAKALRLSGRIEQAKELIARLRNDAKLSSNAMRELIWEQICLGAHSTQDLSDMLAGVRTGKMHYDGIFLLEASLWTRAVAQRQWMGRIIKVTTMGRKKDLNARRFGYFYQAVLQIERCYDQDVPLPIRIRELGEILASKDHFTTIDKELLMWVAAARFLARVSSFALASLTLSEYVALSLKLSQGETQDVLGIAADLIERPWFSSSHFANTSTQYSS